MKMKKFYLTLITLLISLVLLSSTVNASSAFNLNLNSSATSYSKGDTVSVTVNLSNVSDTSGIVGYQANLIYDSNVLTLNNVTSNNWEVMENEGAIVVNTKDALGDTSGTTITANFTIKENTRCNFNCRKNIKHFRNNW